MKKLVIGILAHVDAGKTTLSESMLYINGTIKKLGRVDNKNAFLDTYDLERTRGITIFSKQAILKTTENVITLLDTPGHSDFSAEMERTLQVLDYAILVISGADGVQGHTKTLWRLLQFYHIPVFVFINKMDQAGTNKTKLLKELKNHLHDACIDFTNQDTDLFYEELSMCEECMMEEYLENDTIQKKHIKQAIQTRKVFPCYFGSALKNEGVQEFLQDIENFCIPPSYPCNFGAKIFKITRDEQNNRLTYMKITGGNLKVRSILSNNKTDQQNKSQIWEEKVNQIRIYSGAKYKTVTEAGPGTICTIAGLTQTYPGEGLGIEESSKHPLLKPVLSYQIILPDNIDPGMMLPKLKQLEEEAPELHIFWNEELQEIQVQIMGEVQTEIIKNIILERFGINVLFSSGNIVYKETIKDTVEGIGHFEPLKHYAEVHFILEPGELGSGLVFSSKCSEDELDKNWQRLIMTHLKEKEHKGVLTGSSITDMKITLTAGRAHKKHTEGGDFREATYRAIRQGLMQAHSILLEPYYQFQLEVPEQMVGRAMTDIERMSGNCQLSKSSQGTAILTGNCPISTMQNYHKELTTITRGKGKLFCFFKGYEPCHDQENVILRKDYNPTKDLLNPTDSVFCVHGSGFLVPWNEVKKYMHLESYFTKQNHINQAKKTIVKNTDNSFIDTKEIDKIISDTFYANSGNKQAWKKKKREEKFSISSKKSVSMPKITQKKYLLVDGYNIIFSWSELKELMEINVDSARGALLDILCNYQALTNCTLIVVFDAYRVEGHATEILHYHNIHMVYTKYAETADQYIEKFAHENHSHYNITVATSDGLEQIIIRGQGCALLSARELKEEINTTLKNNKALFESKQPGIKNYLLESLSKESKTKIENYFNDKKNK